MIRRILTEFDVNDFYELRGKHIWVYGEGEGFGFTPKGVSALHTDNKNSKPVMFEEVLTEFKE